MLRDSMPKLNKATKFILMYCLWRLLQSDFESLEDFKKAVRNSDVPLDKLKSTVKDIKEVLAVVEAETPSSLGVNIDEHLRFLEEFIAQKEQT